jgi:hypothetical protein
VGLPVIENEGAQEVTGRVAEVTSLKTIFISAYNSLLFLAPIFVLHVSIYFS